MSVQSDQTSLSEILHEAIKAVETDRSRWTEKMDRIKGDFEQNYTAEVERGHQQFDHRKALIEQALVGLDDGDGSATIPDQPEQEAPEPGPDEPVPMSVGQDKMEKVQALLSERKQLRQADIVKSLSLNSGTVSVALRRLQQQGRVKPGNKSQGSRLWYYAPVSPEKRRETLLRPGEGVSEGRLVS